MDIGMIQLHVINNKILVECNMSLEKATSVFGFSLNRNLVIDGITDGINELDWSIVEEWRPVFRPLCNRVKVSSPCGFNTIHIRYHGKVDGWCNVIDEDKVALSYYSCWYPQESTPTVTIGPITIHGCGDFDVLNADVDPHGQWVYGGKGYDTANIIALKRGSYRRNNAGTLSFFHFLDEEEMVGDVLASHYSRICEYYNHRLFTAKPISNLNIVSLGLPESGGAYFRKELIVMARSSFAPENMSESLGALLAHEMAHTWCTDADCTSWEDWLNETTAEWSALLYALEQNDDRMFNHILDFHKARCNELRDEVILTKNGERPSGTHTKGTMLFYEIYKRLGREVIETLVRTFVSLENKNTGTYLMELRNRNHGHVADIIEKGLTVTSYGDLLH